MQNIILDVVKKNRVYFKCLNEKGYEVKLKITPKSESLPLGKQNLLVNDISIRSKYGVDVIYDLESEIKTEEIVILKHRFNSWLVESCRKLGGKWDKENKVWAFSKIVEDKIEELDFKYNSDIVLIEITAINDTHQLRNSVEFLGYPLAYATGRDSGAQVSDSVALISGRIDSSGSSKNWATQIYKNTSFRLKVSKNLLKDREIIDDFSIKIVDSL